MVNLLCIFADATASLRGGKSLAGLTLANPTEPTRPGHRISAT